MLAPQILALLARLCPKCRSALGKARSSDTAKNRTYLRCEACGHRWNATQSAIVSKQTLGGKHRGKKRKSEAMKPNILDAEIYDGLVIAGLKRIGLNNKRAQEVAANRWPMDARAAIYECIGRGLELELRDLTDFLRYKFKCDTFDDGEPLLAHCVGWIPLTVEELLRWALANTRGKGTDETSEPPCFISIEDMLAGLQSPDMAARLMAGFGLAKSLGDGLAAQGEHRVRCSGPGERPGG
jgi:hypothetical protein